MLIANIWGLNDIGVVLIVVIVLFGASRLPQIAKNLAEGIHEFKKASKKLSEDEKPEGTEDQK